MIARLDEA